MKQKLFLGIIIFAVICLITFSVVGVVSLAANDDNRMFLGDYIQFGIVANSINQTSDMETNFIAGKYQGNGHTIGNTISSSMANASGNIRIGEIISDIQVRNHPAILIDDNIIEQVKSFLEKTKEKSKELSKRNDIVTENVTDINQYTIDITAIDKNIVSVDMESFILALKSGAIQNGALQIKLRESQTIILNCLEKDAITIPRYTVISDKTNENTAQTVIWNLPNVTNLHIASDGMCATIIAPNAYVNIDVTGEGWLVCDTIVSNRGEWHMISQKVPDVSVTPKQTATPEITPTPIAKISPTQHTTNTPVVSPSHTPETTSISTPTAATTITPTNRLILTSTDAPESTPSNELIVTPTAASTPVSVMDEDTPLSAKTLTEPTTPKASTSAKRSKSLKTTTLLNDNVPLSDSAPETGDSFDALTIIMVMLGCLIFIILVIIMNRQ